MITLIDWGIWLLYFAVIFVVLWFYRHSKTEDSIYKWFLKCFLIKVFGGVFFSLIFVYYYGFGDSFEYYKGAVMLGNTLLSSPSDYFDLLFSESSHNHAGHLRQYTSSLAYSDSPEEWFMVKLISPLSILTFKSYLTINLFMSVVSFYGGWKLFKVFSDILPKQKKYAFYAAFLITSMVFWGSGLMKDTLTLAGINYMIYVLYFGILKNNFKMIYLLGTIFWFYITFTLKSYIVIAFFPTVILVVYYKYKSTIESQFVRVVSTPIILTLFLIVGFFSLKGLSETSTKYNANQLEGKVKGFHSWHTTLGGSSYNLGDVEYSVVGAVKKIPAALNATFFRPYVWEAKNVVVILGALESLVLFSLFIYVLVKTKFNPFKILEHTLFLKSLIAFILIFGFAVGFTSYNFGALGRYKMPVMSLFLFLLVYIYTKQKEIT